MNQRKPGWIQVAAELIRPHGQYVQVGSKNIYMKSKQASSIGIPIKQRKIM